MAAPPKITTPSFILKFNFVHTLGTSQKVGTAQYYSYSGGRPLQADVVAFAGDASTAWNAHCASLFTSNGLLSQVTCQDIYDTTGQFGISNASHAGGRAGSQPTTFACANVGYQITQHYRGGKPKGFWPFGIASDTTNDSDWVGAFVTAVNSGVAALAAAIDGATSGAITVGPQQAVSFFSGSQANPDTSKWAPRNSPKPRSSAVIYPVQGWATSAKIASQRRRRI
jgi:hypothetical protein